MQYNNFAIITKNKNNIKIAEIPEEAHIKIDVFNTDEINNINDCSKYKCFFYVPNINIDIDFFDTNNDVEKYIFYLSKKGFIIKINSDFFYICKLVFEDMIFENLQITNDNIMEIVNYSKNKNYKFNCSICSKEQIDDCVNFIKENIKLFALDKNNIYEERFIKSIKLKFYFSLIRCINDKKLIDYALEQIKKAENDFENYEKLYEQTNFGEIQDIQNLLYNKFGFYLIT